MAATFDERDVERWLTKSGPSAARDALEREYGSYREAQSDAEAEIRETDSPARRASLEERLSLENRRTENRLSVMAERARVDADRYESRASAARTEAEAEVMKEEAKTARVQADLLAKYEAKVRADNYADERKRQQEERAQEKRDTQARDKRRAATSKAVRNAGKQTSLLSTSKDTRFMDAAINIGVAAATVVYTATRPGNQSIGFATFWTILGGFMFVESNGELKYGGGAISAANASYLALRLFQLVKVEPSVSTTPIPGTGSGA